MKELTTPISVVQVGRTMIVTPVDNLGELEYEEFEPEVGTSNRLCFYHLNNPFY